MLSIKFSDLNDEDKNFFDDVMLEKDHQLFSLRDKISDDTLLYSVFPKILIIGERNKFSDKLYLLEMHKFAGFDVKKGFGPLQRVMPDDVMLIDFNKPNKSKILDICAFYNRFVDFQLYSSKQRDY